MTDRTTYQTLQEQRAKLKAQAPSGLVDGFERTARKMGAMTIANTLRVTANDPSYTLGDIDPAIIERIALQIERFY